MRRLSGRARVLQLAIVASIAFVIGAATVVVAVGGIPGADRLVHLCLSAGSGTLRAIADTDTCRAQETRLALPAREYVDAAVAAEAAARASAGAADLASARAYTDAQIAAIGDAITVVTVTVNTTTATPPRTETYIEMVPVYAPIGDGSAGYQIVGYREETRTRVIAGVEETLTANAQCPSGDLALAGHGLATPGTVALTRNGPAAGSGAAPTALSAFTGWAVTARFNDTGSLTSRAFCTAAP